MKLCQNSLFGRFRHYGLLLTRSSTLFQSPAWLGMADFHRFANLENFQKQICRFWRSLAPYLVGKYIIPGDHLLSQYHRVGNGDHLHQIQITPSSAPVLDSHIGLPACQSHGCFQVSVGVNAEFYDLHPPKTNGWKLKITPLDRKIFQTSILGFHAGFLNVGICIQTYFKYLTYTGWPQSFTQ